jgi:hypothetical protein
MLLTFGQDELMRAVLPSPLEAHPRAAVILCEALSLWLEQPLSVVLYADVRDASYGLGLCDAFGFGQRSVHYEVDVVDPTRRRRGLGSFRDLRQLSLRGVR